MPTHCISASGYTLTITCTPTLDYTLIPDFIPCSIHRLDASITQPPSALQPHQDCDPMQTPALLDTPILPDLSPCPTPPLHLPCVYLKTPCTG